MYLSSYPQKVRSYQNIQTKGEFKNFDKMKKIFQKDRIQSRE